MHFVLCHFLKKPVLYFQISTLFLSRQVFYRACTWSQLERRWWCSVWLFLCLRKKKAVVTMFCIPPLLTSGLAVCSCRFLQIISAQVSLALAGVQLKQSLLWQTELPCPFCSKQWFFSKVLPTNIFYFTTSSWEEEGGEMQHIWCVWQSKLWEYWRGDRGKALISLPDLWAAAFVKGDDEETFLYSKEYNSNKSIYNISTSLVKEWL